MLGNYSRNVQCNGGTKKIHKFEYSIQAEYLICTYFYHKKLVLKVR